ncbi:MAG: hypothetical protein V1851_02345 [Patescibacteria group bacterium]
MTISRLTALTIQNPNNDIRYEVFSQDEKSGLFAGSVTNYKDGHPHAILLSTNAVYDSVEKTLEAMKNLIEKIQKTVF